MSRLRLNRQPVWANKLTERTFTFKHFKGEAFVLGRFKNKAHLRFMCFGIDEKVKEMEREGLELAGYYALISSTEDAYRLNFFYPPHVEALADEHGESVQRAIVRAYNEP